MVTTAAEADALNTRAQELLPELRKELGDTVIKVSDNQLLKFLRWKANVKRAAGRFCDHLDWKRKNHGLFDESLQISKDVQLERLLQSDVVVAPPQCHTRVGGPLIIGRLRNNDMKDGHSPRDVCCMIFYTLDSVLEDPEAQIHGVTILHDLRGFDRSKNAHIDIPKTLLGGIIGHFPIRIRAIYLLDAPWGFMALFNIISTILFPRKLRERCHFINEKSQLYHDIDQSMLLKELGGDVDFDSAKRVEKQKDREINDALVSLTDLVKM